MLKRELGWGLVLLSVACVGGEIERRKAARRGWGGGGRPAAATQSLVAAVSMDNASEQHSTGDSIELWTNGSLYFDAELPPEGGRVWVRARGTAAAGVGPRLTVLQAGTRCGAVEAAGAWQDLAFALPRGGRTRIELRYDNDAVIGREDRNLEVRHALLEPAGTGWSGRELDALRRRWPVAPLMLAGFGALGLAVGRLGPGRSTAAALLAVVGASRLLTPGQGPWEADEFIFSGAVLDYDLATSWPQPPGCPAWIGLGKLVTAVLHCDAYRALMGLSLACSILTTLPLHALALRLGAAPPVAAAAALIFQFSPAVWLHAPRAFNTGPSLFFLLCALAVLLGRPRRGAGALAGVFLGLCLGLRPQMAPLAVPLALLAGGAVRAGRRVLIQGSAAGLATCAAWLVPAVLDTGLAGYAEALRFKGAQTLEHSLCFGDLPGSLFQPLWGGSHCGAALYALAVPGCLSLLRRNRRVAVALLAATMLSAAWLLGFHGPLVRYRLPLLVPVALLAAEGLGCACRGRSGPFVSAVALLLAWLGTVPVAGLAIAATEPPPPAAFLEHLGRRPHEDALVVFSEPMWPVIRYGRLTQPRFAAARDALRFDGRLTQRPVLELLDLSGQPGPRPSSTEAGWEWIEPSLGSLVQGRYARLFLEPVSVIPARGFWAPELAGAERWRWAAGEAELWLEPAPRGGELRLGFETPEALHAQRPVIEAGLAGPDAEPRLLERFTPGRYERRTWRLGPELLAREGWTRLSLRVRGADLHALPWDGRHLKGQKFPLVLRFFELRWPEADRAGVRAQAR